MRNYIIALSIILFALSGFIKIKESRISAQTPGSHDALKEAVSKDVSPEVEKVPGKMAREQATNQVLAVLGSGSFLSGQVVISEDLMKTVNRIVPDILASPDRRLVIEGHTDNTLIRSSAGREYKDNVELSFLRAKAVAGILVKNKVPLERISVISYGDARPIASNETAEGRARNRRVEIKLVPQETEF